MALDGIEWHWIRLHWMALDGIGWHWVTLDSILGIRHRKGRW